MGRLKLILPALIISIVFYFYCTAPATNQWPPPAPTTVIGKDLESIAELERAKSRPPAATLAVEPASGQGRAYRDIRCTVRLEIPHDAPMPRVMIARLRARKLDYGRIILEVASSEEGVIVLEGKMKAPSRPGKYRLEILAEYGLRGAAIAPRHPGPESAGDAVFHQEVARTDLTVTRWESGR